VPDHAFPDDVFPVVVAHRGASSTRPENTLASFAEALRLGARIVELDVRRTRDGVAVVMHDTTVDRTTDGSGAVADLTASEVAGLNAGTPQSPELVPTLADVLRLVSGRAAVALELKHLPGEPGYDATSRGELVRATHEEVRRTGFEGPVLVLSFDYLALADSKAAAPDVPTGFLTTDVLPPRDALHMALEGAHEMVLPGTRALAPAGASFVAAVHAAGIRVGTWTVDDPDAVRRYLDWGVDAVASNDPETALAVLAERRR
jgi:glycerophosphoryl diester phosphodiesterase